MARLTTRMLACLLGEGDAIALLGDLSEEFQRRSRSDGSREAGLWYQGEICASLAAALRLRVVEFLRSAPWGIAIGAHVLVGVLEWATILVLTRLWPGGTHATSAWRLVLEFPGIAFIAYMAARLHPTAPFVLGAMMLFAAALLSAVTTEAVSTAYVLAFLTLGPLAAFLGGALHRRRSTA